MAISSTLGSIAPYHVLAYSILFGTTTFQSFFNGIVAFKVLPYEHFSSLQSHIFPTYFAVQTVGSLVLLLAPPFSFAAIGSGVTLAKNIALGSAFVGAAVNSLYLGPRTRTIMAKRRELSASDGVHHTDPTASDATKQNNQAFKKVHGASVLLNLVTFIGLAAYGVILTDGFLAQAVKKI